MLICSDPPYPLTLNSAMVSDPCWEESQDPPANMQHGGEPKPSCVPEPPIHIQAMLTGSVSCLKRKQGMKLEEGHGAISPQ